MKESWKIDGYILFYIFAIIMGGILRGLKAIHDWCFSTMLFGVMWFTMIFGWIPPIGFLCACVIRIMCWYARLTEDK